MASRKRKTFGFKTEEELADAVNDEIVNDSDSDRDNIPEFEAVKRVNLKVKMRVIMRVTFQYRVIDTDRCYPNYRVF